MTEEHMLGAVLGLGGFAALLLLVYLATGGPGWGGPGSD